MTILFKLSVVEKSVEFNFIEVLHVHVPTPLKFKQ